MKVKLHHTQPFLETNNFEDRPDIIGFFKMVHDK
jgi:hypothetical protein